jgi:hypothetical protein
MTGPQWPGRPGTPLGIPASAPVPGAARLGTRGLACSLAAPVPLVPAVVRQLLPVPLLPGALTTLALLASPVLAVLGVVLSAIALRDGEASRGRAVTGLVVGSCWLALVAALVAFLAVSLSL